jgi:hypothetical protein
MAATAVAFVFVSMLYRPKKYLQEEADSMLVEQEAEIDESV